MSPMKFTLKNCPDSEWKKGFEKELREIMKKEKRRPDLVVVYVKEVLGE